MNLKIATEIPRMWNSRKGMREALRSVFDLVVVDDAANKAFGRSLKRVKFSGGWAEAKMVNQPMEECLQVILADDRPPGSMYLRVYICPSEGIALGFDWPNHYRDTREMQMRFRRLIEAEGIQCIQSKYANPHDSSSDGF